MARNPAGKSTAKTPPRPAAHPTIVAARDRAIRSRIRSAHRRRASLWLAGDAERYLAHYWDDAVLVVDGHTITIPEFRQWLHATLAAGGGSLAFQLPPLDDVAISPLGDAATTIFGWGQRFRTAEGEVSDRTCFETNVWYLREGAWKIIRLHLTTIARNVITT